MDDLYLSFPPDFVALTAIRDQFRAWLVRSPAAPTTVEELVLAADELCTNAVEAAVDGTIDLEARCDGSAVHFAVSNTGHVAEELSRPSHSPDLLVERGRGIAIVRAFTDSLAIVNVDGRTVARAVRLLS